MAQANATFQVIFPLFGCVNFSKRLFENYTVALATCQVPFFTILGLYQDEESRINATEIAKMPLILQSVTLEVKSFSDILPISGIRLMLKY